MTALRQHVHAPVAAEAFARQRAIEAGKILRSQRRMAPFEQHQLRTGRGGEHARKQRIVVRMDLEQRLRTQEEKRALRQAEAVARRVIRSDRPRVSGPDAGDPHQPLGVVRVAIGRLHRRAREEDVDGRVTGRHRMAPRGTLKRCEAQRGQRKDRRVHAELRIDQHVERVVADRRRDPRWRPPRAVADDVRACGETVEQRVGSRLQMVEHDLERVAVEIGDPVFEVAAHGAVAEERRHEADARPPCAGIAMPAAARATPARPRRSPRRPAWRIASAARDRRHPGRRGESCSSAGRPAQCPEPATARAREARARARLGRLRIRPATPPATLRFPRSSAASGGRRVPRGSMPDRAPSPRRRRAGPWPRRRAPPMSPPVRDRVARHSAPLAQRGPTAQSHRRGDPGHDRGSRALAARRPSSGRSRGPAAVRPRTHRCRPGLDALTPD